MQSYKEFIRDEAQKLIREVEPRFAGDASGRGGKSSSPSFVTWCDEKNIFAGWVERITKGWGKAQFLWVEGNTRNKEPGGATPENAFASVLRDLVREVRNQRKRE